LADSASNSSLNTDATTKKGHQVVYKLLCSGIEHKTRTVDSSISTEALEQFAEDGYLVLENGIIDEALKGLQQAFDEVITQELEAGGLEDGEFVRDLPCKHDTFFELILFEPGPRVCAKTTATGLRGTVSVHTAGPTGWHCCPEQAMMWNYRN